MTKLKGNRLKGLSALAATLAVLAFSARSYAANFTFDNRVQEIMLHNTAVVNQGDWFTIVGLSSAGSCATSGGFVIIKLPSRTTAEYKEMVSMLHAAKLSGRKLKGQFTDTVLTNSYCTLSYLHLQQ